MIISIYLTVLSGNLGDGWRDEDETAAAYAEFVAAQWRMDLKSVVRDGADLSIDIDVQRASGVTHGVVVEVDPYDDYAAMERVSNMLTPDSALWPRFCAEATEYYANGGPH